MILAIFQLQALSGHYPLNARIPDQEGNILNPCDIFRHGGQMPENMFGLQWKSSLLIQPYNSHFFSPNRVTALACQFVISEP